MKWTRIVGDGDGATGLAATGVSAKDLAASGVTSTDLAASGLSSTGVAATGVTGSAGATVRDVRWVSESAPELWSSRGSVAEAQNGDGKDGEDVARRNAPRLALDWIGGARFPQHVGSVSHDEIVAHSSPDSRRACAFGAPAG